MGGAVLEFSADVLAHEKESAKLIIRLENGHKFHSDRHTGGGGWERLTATARIPDTWPHDWVYVTLHHYNTPESTARFRDARVAAVAP